MAKHDYQNDYPSVTQVLDVLRKIGLENWFKYTPIQQIQKESNEGKAIGTQIHDAIHSYIQNEEVKVETQYGEQVQNALQSFMQFRKAFPNIKLINSEMSLTSEKHKFNGTLDCLGEEDGLLIIADWKTGKAKDKDIPPIFDEYFYQVAAYTALYNEVKQAKIEKAIIVAIAKDKVAYNMQFYEGEILTDCFNEVFLSALKILNFKRSNKEE